MRGRALTLTIDGVVVDGLAPEEARRFGLSLQRELTVLLEERGLPESLTSSGEVAEADLGELDLPAAPGPGLLGRAVAVRLYECLDGPLPEALGGPS